MAGDFFSKTEGKILNTKKSMGKLKKLLFGRLCLVILAILFQVAWIIFTVVVLGTRFPAASFLIQLLTALALLGLVSKDINPAFKIAWVILILVFPVAGAVIYLLFSKPRLPHQMLQRIQEEGGRSAALLKEAKEARAALSEKSQDAELQSRYIRDYGGYPVYQGTQTQYFRVGEELYETLIEELKGAKRFIFLEYFIIDDGEMWQGILDILAEKVKRGVDVRLIYDDLGCVSTLPSDFREKLQARGIRCEVFNRFMPIVSAVFNNRDHRKITVIDGHTAFTGGINLADEYINRKERFGYWKDTGIMLKGEAVWSFTVMFAQMWQLLCGEKIDYERLRPEMLSEEQPEDGFVQPYSDSPLDHETVGEMVYLNIINRAKKYLYIFTPYLITDNEVLTALRLAAKSGVDVRIVTPGIPDKKMVFLLTQSYYRTLLQAGVRIFEYKPGFLHAKSFVCDDEIATVGTVNLDFRSLYLHFECGVWMYRSEAVLQIKEDAMAIFRECREITEKDCRSWSAGKRLVQAALRLFAPLM